MVLMRDPVVLPSGETYERNTIMRSGLRDPQTREQLTAQNLTSNRALRRQIDRHLKTSVESRIEQIKAAGSDGWESFQELLCALVDDSSDPALFAQTHLLSFLRDDTFASALLERSSQQQQKVISAMIDIRSTLVKECLHIVLSWYAQPARPQVSRPKRPKRAASAQHSPASQVRPRLLGAPHSPPPIISWTHMICHHCLVALCCSSIRVLLWRISSGCCAAKDGGCTNHHI